MRGVFFTICSILLITSSGCTIEEVQNYGSACSPTVAEDGYVDINGIKCYADRMEGFCVTSKGKCRSTKQGCAFACNECARYQKDFDKLVKNAQAGEKRKYVDFIIGKQGEEKIENYSSLFSDGVLNKCPENAPFCVWNGTKSLTFGCIDCSKNICGTECVDLQTNSKHCGQCGNACSSSCKDGSCVETTISCEDDEHITKAMKCEKDSVTQCGSELNDCTGLVGWADGDCIQKKCIASECKTDYHLEDKTCTADTDDCCGPNCLKCDGMCKAGQCVTPDTSCNDPLTLCGLFCVDLRSSTENCGDCGNHCDKGIPNSTKTACVDSQCTAYTCKEQYHLYQGTCEPDSNESCGAHDNNCHQMPGVQTGECINGSCAATSCISGYHLVGNQCEADSNDCCGDTCNKCDGIYKCSNGQCVSGCVAPQISCGNGCYDITSDVNNCGGCGIQCTPDNIPNSASVICENAVCTARTCQNKFHLYNNTCEADSVYDCGSHGAVCNVDNAVNSCMNGKCNFSCKPGFHRYELGCEPNDVNHCGSHDKVCNVANATNSCSLIGICSFTCNQYYHKYNGECEINSISNCGAHAKSCVIPNAQYSCVNGTCKFTCNINYHSYNNMCEINSISNCGAHNKKCNVANATNSCSTSGVCTFTCRKEYHKYNSICELNTLTNCGSHGISCTTDKVPHSTAVSCSLGKCEATACGILYKLNNGECKSII